MRYLKNIHIKNKIIIIILITGIISAITGGVSSYIYEIKKSKNLIVNNLKLQAKLLSDYCGIPMEFNYTENASEVLQSLHNIDFIVNGTLFTADGKVFTSYYKQNYKVDSLPVKLKQTSYFIEKNYLHLSEPVIYNGKTYGNLYLLAFIDWKSLMYDQIITTLIVIAIMLTITLILAYSLHKNISNPIIELTNTMNKLATEKDYTIHLPDLGRDELGELYSGFNYMISEISLREIELQKANQYLKISEEKFRNVIEKLPFPVAIVDPNGTFNFWNEKFTEVIGYSKSDIVTIEDWWEKAYPDEKYRKWVIENWGNAIDKAKELNTNIIPYEYEVTCKNGIKRIMEISGIVLKDNILGTFIDLTERKIAEENLKNSERKFAEMTSNVPGVIYQFEVINKQDVKFHFVSPKITEIFELKLPENIEQFNFEDIICKEDKESFISYLKHAIINKEAFNYEGRLNTPKGLVWFQNLAWPLQYGKNILFNGIVIDINERKQIEFLIHEKTAQIELQNVEYLQLNEELIQTNEELSKAKAKAEESDLLKTAFLQNVSHEIRTPMNAIMGFSELLLQNFENKQKLEYFSKIIIERCSDLLNIINDILEISKIESGQIPVNAENCNISGLLNELLEFFQGYRLKIGKQNIELKTFISCSKNAENIKIDQNKLKQIFINLISNAFKFTNHGTIEAGCNQNENGKLMFYVSDTGIGIPEDKHSLIFERFFQLNQQQNKPVQGTGLGLPIVKGLVQLLSGEIWLNSEEGKGTTFYFTLPYTKSEDSINLSNQIDSLHIKELNLKNVLIVEDDIYNAEYLKEILYELHLHTKHAENGFQAIEFIQNNNFDLILMDVRLPDTNGYALTKKALTINPHLKIIAQTAYASSEEKTLALNAGCIDYISKPINKNAFLKMLYRNF